MNQLVIFMATLLLVATTLVTAMPIPESFIKRNVVAEKRYDHEAWQRQALASQQAVADQMAAENEVWQKEALASQSAVAAAQASAFYAEAAAAGHPAHGQGESIHNTKQAHQKPTVTTTTEAPKATTTPAKKHTTTTTEKPEPTTTTVRKEKPTTTTTTTTIKTTTTTTTTKKPTTTTTTVKPTTTTTTQKPTTTTTTQKPTTTTTTEKPKETGSSGGGSGSGSNSGEGTFYNTGLGSCGITNTDSDLIAAMNYIDMANGANPNNNPNCGRKIKVYGPNGSVTVEITDTCPTCAKGDVDLSPAAFGQIAEFDAGRVDITWDWIS